MNLTTNPSRATQTLARTAALLIVVAASKFTKRAPTPFSGQNANAETNFGNGSGGGSEGGAQQAELVHGGLIINMNEPHDLKVMLDTFGEEGVQAIVETIARITKYELPDQEFIGLDFITPCLKGEDFLVTGLFRDSSGKYWGAHGYGREPDTLGEVRKDHNAEHWVYSYRLSPCIFDNGEIVEYRPPRAYAHEPLMPVKSDAKPLDKIA